MKKINRKHKKRDTDKILTIIIVTVLTILLSVSYIHKKIMLNDYMLTTCIYGMKKYLEIVILFDKSKDIAQST